MDHKSWLWKKRSTEKTIISEDKPNLSLSRTEEETLLNDKAQLERDLKILNDKLSSALSECNNQDDFAKKQANIAQEAIAGWEKTETEALSLKQELEKALQQRAASEERLLHLDAALKECMQQLRFVREDQEKRIHDAVMETSKEFKNTRFVLDQKLAEAKKRLAKVDGENSQFSKALLAKERVIQELNTHRAQMETDFNSLMTRLESTEKENASLKYEVRVLEKELEIRNEEREFNRQTADVAHKQYLESVKKIAKLESECQRLRVLVCKRLPGPAALAKMKNEVAMLGRDQPETRRRKSNPSSVSSMDFSVDVAPDTPWKKINFLTEQLCLMEEENSTLKEALNKRMSERQSSAVMYSQTASRLSQVEGQLGGHLTAEQGNKHSINEFSAASISDIGVDDKASCVESWASALISELEQFRSGKQVGTPSSRTVGASDMSLMDDFVEMEKFAVVSADNSMGVINHVAENDATQSPLRTQPSEYVPEAASTAIPACHQSNLSVPNHQILPQNVLTNQVPSSLESIMQIVLEQSQVLQRNPSEILDEIKTALLQSSYPNSQCADNRERLNQDDAQCVTESMFEGFPHKFLVVDSADKGTCNATSPTKKSSQKLQFNLSKSIHKIIELIEGISLLPLDDGNTEMLSRTDDSVLQYNNSETSTSYVGRVFQWKASELSSILKQFVGTCSDLLNGKSDLVSFAEQLACTLEWIMNHCFSLQDVSSMKDAIRSYFDWDESRSESEVDSGTINHVSESNKLNVLKGEVCSLPLPVSNGKNSHVQVEEVQPDLTEEYRSLKDKLPNKESAENDFEGRLQLEVLKSESPIIQLQDSHKTIKTLQMEVECLEQMKEETNHQNLKHKQVKEDLETQLMEAKNESREACEKHIYGEKELQNNKSYCQKLDETYHDLQLPIESMVEKVTADDMANNEKELRTDWEIVAASEKLAECQETILNLGKQLKALASPVEAALFDKVISSPSNPVVATMTTPDKNTHQRSSLLDKMLAEDKSETEDLKSPITKEIILDGSNYSAFGPNWTTEPPERFTSPNGVNRPKNEAVIGSMAFVPGKKRGNGGLLMKLLRKGKKGSCKEIT